MCPPTCDYDKRSKAGKGGHINVHAMEALGELDNGIYPFPKAPDTLHTMQHHSIAEDQLALFWLRPVKEKVWLCQRGRLSLKEPTWPKDQKGEVRNGWDQPTGRKPIALFWW